MGDAVMLPALGWWGVVTGFVILILVILWDRYIQGKLTDDVTELRMTNNRQRGEVETARRMSEFLEKQLEDEIDDAASVRKKVALLEQMNHALFEANKVLLRVDEERRAEEAERLARNKAQRERRKAKKGDT